jgi:sigma-E factor negative regulatory protein RseA
MNEQQRQALSALVDGELPAHLAPGLLDAVERDADLQAMWERYHLIGGALRREGAPSTYREVAAGVRARVASEPTVLAPAAARGRRLSRLAPFAGVALAASAAFLAVFAVPSLFEPAATPAVGPAAAQMAVVPASAGSPAGVADRFLVSRPGPRWHVDQPGVENQLDRLLVSHQEYAPATGINGMLPYATLVSYDAGR